MSRRLLLSAVLLAPIAAGAQAARPVAAPRDTSPPSAHHGVLEYQEARRKLELDMQRGGFTVYIIGDMEGLAAVVRNARPVSHAGWKASRNGLSAEDTGSTASTSTLNGPSVVETNPG